jgi:hypothetical protein
MEPQIVEILGRNRLIDELLRAGLEVATPERDRGIDLLVYKVIGGMTASGIKQESSQQVIWRNEWK